MPDKTPAASLTGPELCKRVALGMRWKVSPNECFATCQGLTLPDGSERSIPYGIDLLRSMAGQPMPKKYFRPDLDGNHLAEVIAHLEAGDDNWEVSSDLTDLENRRKKPEYRCLIWMHGRVIEEWGNSFPLALLRAFVAACEAEKATSEGTRPS